MSDIVYVVRFYRYDEDCISVISSHERYFKLNLDALNAAEDWIKQSPRHDIHKDTIEVE